MSAPLEPEAWLVPYLLGALSAEEHAQMEERLFHDDALSEELHAAADDLIQAYLAGSLSEGDRARFETHFLVSARRRQRLDFMRALLPAVCRAPPARVVGRGWLPWAAAACLAIAGTAALVAVLRQSRERTAVVENASPSPVSSPTPSPADPARTEPPETVIRLVRARPSEPVEVPMAEHTRVVRLEVAVPEEGPAGYHAVLRSADGKEVWRAKGLAPASSGAPLVLTVPARVLVAADYRLSVGGETLREQSAPRAPDLEFVLRVVHQRQSP